MTYAWLHRRHLHDHDRGVDAVDGPHWRISRRPSLLAFPPRRSAASGTLPLALSFEDDKGRSTDDWRIPSVGVPAVVIFADFTCRTLCGPIVEFTAAGLAKTGLRSRPRLSPGRDRTSIRSDGIDTAHERCGPQHIDARTIRSAAPPCSWAAVTPIHSRTQRKPSVFHYAYDAEARSIRASGGRLSSSTFDGRVAPRHVTDRARRRRSAVSHYRCRPRRRRRLCRPTASSLLRLRSRRKGIYTERITTMLGYGLPVATLAHSGRRHLRHGRASAAEGGAHEYFPIHHRGLRLCREGRSFVLSGI